MGGASTVAAGGDSAGSVTKLTIIFVGGVTGRSWAAEKEVGGWDPPCWLLWAAGVELATHSLPRPSPCTLTTCFDTL